MDAVVEASITLIRRVLEASMMASTKPNYKNAISTVMAKLRFRCGSLLDCALRRDPKLKPARTPARVRPTELKQTRLNLHTKGGMLQHAF